MFPLVAANNEVIGTLSFDTVTKQRSWSDETGSRLRSARADNGTRACTQTIRGGSARQ